uniref:Serpentine receptor class gamma n=1 Tax=Globodera pallida TaxID=36090 RepID=A0A183CU01_GLOPA
IYLKLPPFVLAFLFFVIRYAFHVENLLTASLLLNRFTSIFWPLIYNKIWRYALVPVLLATFILPLPFTVPIFNLDMYIHRGSKL